MKTRGVIFIFQYRATAVFYGPVALGFLDTHRHQFHRALSAAVKRKLGLD